MDREAQKEAIADGTKIELDEGAALLASFGQASMELLGDRITFGLSRLWGVNIEKIIRKGGLFTRGVKGAAVGVTAEVPTEIGQQVIERFQAGRPIDSPEAIEEYMEVGASAVLAGGATRAVTNIVGGDPVARAEKLEKLEAKKLEDAKRALGMDGGAGIDLAADGTAGGGAGIDLAADGTAGGGAGIDLAATREAAITAAEKVLTVAEAEEAALDAVINNPNASAVDTLDANIKKKTAKKARTDAAAAVVAAKDAQGFAQFVEQDPELRDIGQQKRRELFEEYKTTIKAQASYASGANTLQDLYTGFGIKTKDETAAETVAPVVETGVDAGTVVETEGDIYFLTKLADITPEIAATIVKDFAARKVELVGGGKTKNRVLAKELDLFTTSPVFQNIEKEAAKAPAASAVAATVAPVVETEVDAGVAPELLNIRSS
jgi:hypothetical protein